MRARPPRLERYAATRRGPAVWTGATACLCWQRGPASVRTPHGRNAPPASRRGGRQRLGRRRPPRGARASRPAGWAAAGRWAPSMPPPTTPPRAGGAVNRQGRAPRRWVPHAPHHLRPWLYVGALGGGRTAHRAWADYAAAGSRADVSLPRRACLVGGQLSRASPPSAPLTRAKVQ